MRRITKQANTLGFTVRFEPAPRDRGGKLSFAITIGFRVSQRGLLTNPSTKQ